MCQSMVNIQSPTAEIRRGKKRRKKERNRMKIYMVSLFHRATIKSSEVLNGRRATNHYANIIIKHFSAPITKELKLHYNTPSLSV